MPEIKSVQAFEILDSRGHPTLQVSVTLSDGVEASAGVPAGASTGQHEAVELRDAEPDRYSGRGVLAAVGSVRRQINDALRGMKMHRLEDVLEADRIIEKIDGTENLSRLGANAAVGVSMALARAVAVSWGVPLWQVLLQEHSRDRARIPVPHFNVVNGGAHAENPLDFQEFMIAPIGSPSFAEALRAGAEIYASLRGLLSSRGMPTGLGDEGGFAVPTDRPEKVLSLIVQAIEAAGYRAGRDGVAIALDPAANGFCTGENHQYRVAGSVLSSAEMVAWYQELVRAFPIWSIEDGLAEDDTSGWRDMTAALGETIQVVGDDIFVTDAERVRRAVSERIANACLLKPNQAGNLVRTLETVAACSSVRYGQMASHRSGETVDSFIADFAVGIGCGQLKSGAPARGERLSKYNRLLEIEHHARLPYGLVDSDVRN
jgi:enolase